MFFPGNEVAFLTHSVKEIKKDQLANIKHVRQKGERGRERSFNHCHIQGMVKALPTPRPQSICSV